ncbi:response regulator [Clostridium sp. MCC353]|uniref:response regulator n=1 Tax=Clostridium sp. MCC353 TaxID=2592646 RepID=UPI001C01F0DD|nr:response regulator [Clostridium sp. MCC353]MBT9779200.1 response regulator [Clostridium sp. MCC353]
MIKLLIVDDEPLVQIGIKSMINWAEHGIEICGTAMNGEAALKLIKEYSPELVITDIKMPIMNGLDLAKTCRDTYGPIPLFIFLTSYEEFQLIKQALSYQAVDYLIKLELDAQSLTDSVKRAIERLEDLKVSEAYKKEGGRPLLQNYNDKFLMRLLYNLFDSREQFEIQAKDLKLDFTDLYYIACHGEIYSEKADSMEPAQQVNLYSSSLQMTREILSKYLACYIISLDKRHFAVIFYSASKKDLSLSSLKEALDNTCHMVYNYFSVRLTAGIGSIAEDPLKISESYQEARRAFNMASPDSPIMTFSSITEDVLKNSFNLALFKDALTKAFEEFDTDVLNTAIAQITELFASHPLRYLQAMDGACNILYLAISLLPDGEETMNQIFSGHTDGYRSIYKLKNVDQVNEWLETFRSGLNQVLQSKRKTYKDHVITNVQKYINNHVEERLTLNEVAAVFGLSPNYLSALFKKSCNIGFSEYITQKKIAKAKNLLLEENMKIYEVADMLGFESAFYFSKVFKKVEGISPREYVQAHLTGPMTF